MQDESFKFNSDRCLSVWAIHGGTVGLLFLLSLIFTIQTGLPDFKDFIARTIFFALIYGPHTFIFLNHLKHERNTIVVLNDKQISVIKKDIKKTFNLEDVIVIKQYEARRTWWPIMVKWKIISAHDEATISNITFPRTKAWRVFGNKLSNETSIFPIFSSNR